MPHLLLNNVNENQPILTGEIAVLNTLSKKADSLIAGVNKFLQSPFSFTRKRSTFKANEIILEPVVESVMLADAVQVSTAEYKEKLREMICIESKLKEVVGSLSTVIAGKFNQFKIVEAGDHFVSANRKAINVVFKNLLYFINEKNHHQQVRIEVFEDIDFTVIVAKHQGMRLLRSELMKIYQAPPGLIADFGNTLLYTSWHLLKATGGWLTTGENDGVNYISIGLPK